MATLKGCMMKYTKNNDDQLEVEGSRKEKEQESWMKEVKGNMTRKLLHDKDIRNRNAWKLLTVRLLIT